MQPPSFREMQQLRILVLDSNQFVDFPVDLYHLTSLEVLQFSRNKLRSITNNRFADMASLQVQHTSP